MKDKGNLGCVKDAQDGNGYAIGVGVKTIFVRRQAQRAPNLRYFSGAGYEESITYA